MTKENLYKFNSADKIPEMVAPIGTFFLLRRTAIKNAAYYRKETNKPFCILKARGLIGYLVVAERQLEKISNQLKVIDFLKK
ncbi:MAG: hypothetical protein PHQ35_10635 [Phycisphaerae bacterium]|nr:hypothetical protein [Phycisphaerae bacterium]